jgi:hypothetical protein
MRAGPWVGAPDWGVKDYFDGAVFVMTRTHGAPVALKVALASFAFAFASLAVTKLGTARSRAMPVPLPRP